MPQGPFKLELLRKLVQGKIVTDDEEEQQEKPIVVTLCQCLLYYVA